MAKLSNQDAYEAATACLSDLETIIDEVKGVANRSSVRMASALREATSKLEQVVADLQDCRETATGPTLRPPWIRCIERLPRVYDFTAAHPGEPHQVLVRTASGVMRVDYLVKRSTGKPFWFRHGDEKDRIVAWMEIPDCVSV
jgi:hypothetical protein